MVFGILKREQLVAPVGRKQLAVTGARYKAFLNGEKTAEDLDWEELLRGQVRGEDGTFSGPRPNLLPRAWSEALAKEVLERADSKFRENYDVAMMAIVEMVKSPRTPAREKLAAAQYIIERTIGKIPDKQQMQLTVSKFEEMVNGGELVIDIEEAEEVEER